ncbi:hypothetical protein BOTNAR_0396g00110 [Botryotinia narcissicola]|uniref:Uncharacterized protein n=1 Tax=Botryotinia narcissicola TaxID=278944 RepID=A0A4Z1I0F9_9HELO|nr:hypothetical protein BOTNAR_0396g00110 [Botryotinia narcissicola]
MSTATEKGLVSSDYKKFPALARQKKDVKGVQPVLDPDDEASRYPETLRDEFGISNVENDLYTELLGRPR